VKRLGLITLLFALLATGVSASRAEQATVENASAPGEVLVKFTPGASVEARAAAVAAVGGEIVDMIEELDVAVVRTQPAQADVQAAEDVLSTLEQNTTVEYAEPNYILTTLDEVDPASATYKVRLPLVFGPPYFQPNDPSRSIQYAWGKIGAYEGWGYNQGLGSTVIAVVDSGIQLNHPDLDAKIVAGYDYVDDDTAADDGNGHGTHVAGIAAAETNNGIGIAGTCPNCKLMPVRVLDNSGAGYTSDVAAGILLAANNGAKVINLSLGGTSTNATLENAVNQAWSKGAVVVCAAGNNGDKGNPIMYPGYYANCLAVGATTSTDARATYSEYGTWVDIAAPGSGIYSTYKGSAYTSLNGTSMASPHVAGVAGLLASQGLNNAEIRARLENMADKISGTDTYWSNGRLNLLRSVRGY